VIGCCGACAARRESQNTEPNQSKLTLSARESVASSLASFREAFFIFGAFDLNFLCARWRFAAVLATCGLVCAGAASIASAQTGAAAAAKNARAVRHVTDDSGTDVAVPSQVDRIVTLAPNLTETVYALGLEDKLAADTTYCDVPPAAKSKPHVGGPANPNLESIVAARPDLVLATTMTSRETVDSLRKLGLAVYFSDPHTVRAMLATTTTIADISGANAKGTEVVAGLQARLDALHGKLEEKPLEHVLFVVWEDPLISIGQNTFVADALKWAGGESAIQASQDWPQVSLEEVLRLEPDYIVLTPDHAETDNSKVVEGLRGRAIWRDLRAVKLGRVALADEEFIRPSPGLVASIESLARQLHPDVFGAPAPMPPAAIDGKTSGIMNKGCVGCGL
jgi:iron complex transport system substrate-binding protein